MDKNRVVLYSIGCPKCRVMEAKLKERGVSYTLCSSEEEMQELGIEEVPMLRINGHLKRFAEGVRWINEQ